MNASVLVLALMAVGAREIIVDPSGAGDFKTITEAVEAAQPGDVVTVRAGIYREEVRLQGKKGTAERPILIQADPEAPVGSVILDGSRSAPAGRWQRFVSSRYGVQERHGVWWTAHDPRSDCTGNELIESAWPYKLHKGGYLWDGSRGGSGRWATAQVFRGDRRLQIVPTHPRSGRMSDRAHADSEETQSEEYITAGHPKFLKPGQWIWYDDGRTDGSDEDEDTVPHPEELRHRIFVRLPAGEEPSGLSYTVRTTCVSLSGCAYLTFRGLRLRRAVSGFSAGRECRRIRLQNLVVEEFGCGRKFYPCGGGIPEHLWSGGSGIVVRSGTYEITGCLIQNGVMSGISMWGKRNPDHEFRVLYCTIRNIGPHPWGGGWAHGKGKGIGTGMVDNVLVAKNVIQDCTNTGIWLDGGNGDRNIKIIGNRFKNCRNIGIFSETNIGEVLVAYNVVEGGDRGFRIGPISRRSRIIGNLFRGTKLGGTTGVYKSRMHGKTDTVDYFALAGNVFADCRHACFTWTDDALKSPHFYWDHNVWHTGSRAQREKPFILDWRPRSLNGMWKDIRSSKFAAGGRHSRVVEERPDLDPRSLVTDALLRDLQEKGFLSEEERRLLTSWR